MGRIRVVRGMGGGDEEGVGGADPGPIGVTQAGPFLGWRTGAPVRVEQRAARLDVLGAVAEALCHGQAQPVGAARQHPAVGPVAPPGVGLDAEQAEACAGEQQGINGIVRRRPSGDLQVAAIRRRDKARRAGQHADVGLADRIGGRHHQEGQAGEEGPVLLRHLLADHPRPHLGEPLPAAGGGLEGRLSGMEDAVHGVQARSPAAVTGMGKKPGSASTLASQARMAG